MKLGGKLTLFRRPSASVTIDCLQSVLARKPVQLISRRASFVLQLTNCPARHQHFAVIVALRKSKGEIWTLFNFMRNVYLRN